MVEYCREHGIAHEVCGKVVVAVDDDERARLVELERRCRVNGVRVESDRARAAPRDRAARRRRSPRCTCSTPASPTTPRVCRVARRARSRTPAARLQLDTAVARRAPSSADGLVVETSRGRVAARRVVTCAGLQADRLAVAVSGPGRRGGTARSCRSGASTSSSRPSASHLVRTLIYPVPDPQFPFLGVHLTRGIDGHVHVGPERGARARPRGLLVARARLRRRPRHAAVLRAFASSRRSTGATAPAEMARSVSKRRFVRALQPAGARGDGRRPRAGARPGCARRRSTADGDLVDDFAFQQVGRALHVLNAPSPAATASLEIGTARSPRRLSRSELGSERRQTLSLAVAEHVRGCASQALPARAAVISGMSGALGPSGPRTHGRLAHTSSPTRTDTGMIAPASCVIAWTSPLTVSPMPVHRRALEVAHLVRGAADVVLDRLEALGRELDPALRRELDAAGACRPSRCRAGTPTSHRARPPPRSGRCADAPRTPARSVG